MNGFSFGEPYWAALLLLLPLYWWNQVRRLKEKEAFSSRFSPGLLKGGYPFFSRLRLGFFLVGSLLLVISLMDPRLPLPEEQEEEGEISKEIWTAGEEKEETTRVQRRHHEVLFLIDASASMEVTDTRTGESRLEKAKEFVEEIIRKLDGQEVAVYAFTAEPTLIVPPTHDYLFARFQTRRIAVNEGDVAGTDLMELFGSIRQRHLLRAPNKQKTIILLTDGGDTRIEVLEGEEREKEVHLLLSRLEGSSDLNSQLFCIGLGTAEGKTIPGVEFKGEPVHSSLDEQLLGSLATKGEGTFFLEQNHSVLSIAEAIGAEILRDEMTREEEVTLAAGEMERERDGAPQDQQHLFQIPLGGALICLALFWLLPQTRRIAVALLILTSHQLIGEHSESWYREQLKEGNEQVALSHNLALLLLQEGKIDDALAQFRLALAKEKEKEEIFHHAALASLANALSQEDEAAVKSLEEGISWLQKAKKLAKEEELTVQLESELREELALRKERLRLAALKEATALQLITETQKSIGKLREGVSRIDESFLPKEKQKLARAALSLNEDHERVAELLKREENVAKGRLQNSLRQAEEWLLEGEKERGWSSLTEAGFRTSVLTSLEKEEQPLGVLLTLPVDEREWPFLREVVEEETSRALPPTGNEEEDRVRQELLHSMQEWTDSHASQEELLALYNQLGKTEGESLLSLRSGVNPLELAALKEKLKVRLRVVKDSEQRKKIQQTLSALDSEAYDQALLAWSPSDYLMTTYQELASNLAAKGMEEAKQRLAEWRELAEKFPDEPAAQLLLPRVEKGVFHLSQVNSSNKEWVLQAVEQFLKQAIVMAQKEGGEPKETLRLALAEQEETERLTADLHSLNEKGEGLPQELLEQLQLTPRNLAPCPEEVQEMPEQVQQFIADGSNAAGEAEQLLEKRERKELPSAREQQLLAIENWRKALDEWENPDSDQGEGEGDSSDGDQTADAADSEENSPNEPENQESGQGEMAQEWLELYQKMEQEDQPEKEASGVVREGVRPW